MSALLWFAIWAALIFLMLRFGCGAHIMGHSRSGRPHACDGNLRWQPPEWDVDVVCGKRIRTAGAKPSVFNGLVYYFCSRECREVFEAAPDSYVEGNRSIKQLGDSHA